jgi:hypothetical protein
MKTKHILQSFLIGSSIFSTFITLSYVGMANIKFKGLLNYEIFSIILPILFGIFNIFHYILLQNTKNDMYSLLIGLIFGLTLSIIGRFGLDLPIKIFGFSKENEYQVHLYASVIYPLIFYFIIRNLNYYFINIT